MYFGLSRKSSDSNVLALDDVIFVRVYRAASVVRFHGKWFSSIFGHSRYFADEAAVFPIVIGKPPFPQRVLSGACGACRPNMVPPSVYGRGMARPARRAWMCIRHGCRQTGGPVRTSSPDNRLSYGQSIARCVGIGNFGRLADTFDADDARKPLTGQKAIARVYIST